MAMGFSASEASSGCVQNSIIGLSPGRAVQTVSVAAYNDVGLIGVFDMMRQWWLPISDHSDELDVGLLSLCCGLEPKYIVDIGGTSHGAMASAR